jgi:hypothetical protein
MVDAVRQRLDGRVEIKQIADFDRTRRREFADRICRTPPNQDLRRMTGDEINAVVRACQFGWTARGRRRSRGKR